MKKIVATQWLVAFFAAITLISLLAWAGAKKATVHSSPLDCYTQGEKTICLDIEPGADISLVKCEMLDPQIMLCGSAN